MSSAATPGWAAERSHSRWTPDARTLERSPGWRPLQRGVRRRATVGEEPLLELAELVRRNWLTCVEVPDDSALFEQAAQERFEPCPRVDVGKLERDRQCEGMRLELVPRRNRNRSQVA